MIRTIDDLAQENRWIEWKEFPDGRYAAVVQFLFTHAILVGMIGDNVYTDRWCYETKAAAIIAFNHWDGTGEPIGCHRHPQTGRRRINGDPTTQYINF